MAPENRPRRLGGALGASLILHLGLAVALLFVLSFPPATASSPEPPIPLNVVYLPADGPAGGGGGKPTPAPPRQLQVAPHNLPEEERDRQPEVQDQRRTEGAAEPLGSAVGVH